MNTSERRINQEVKAVLQSSVEPAFEGTVLEGKERKYTIINEHDLRKYIDIGTRQDLAIVLDKVLGNIEHGREGDGKAPFNSYIVINTDEPYVGEIIEIMKRYGHWG